VAGFRVSGVACGLKKDNRLDFALVTSDQPCVAAGVFTTNLVKAAPVLVDMQVLENNPQGIRAIAINTGCANACTGRKGIQDAHVTATWVADTLGIRQESVLVMSTGVIGTHLPMDKIRLGVTEASRTLGSDWAAAATAIMTTDTRPKQAAASTTTATGQTYNLAGICKGAGMIAPNMATMLGIVVTDAALTVEQAQTALRAATNTTFNRIVVDGDMSTNDTVLMLANGASGVQLADADLPAFTEALTALCRSLAQAIVRDGEGVTKFITLNIVNAPTDDAARQIANTIATSPLVKTAFYGGDANWGRIVAAAGRAGVPLDPDQLELWVAPGETSPQEDRLLQLFDHGIAARYNEEQASAVFANPSISILLDCGTGSGQATVWTCDLSHDYVSINGHYRS
jgi:glutamate N-acetyltransferase/amino-acid N-acetyltransferase